MTPTPTVKVETTRVEFLQPGDVIRWNVRPGDKRQSQWRKVKAVKGQTMNTSTGKDTLVVFDGGSGESSHDFRSLDVVQIQRVKLSGDRR